MTATLTDVCSDVVDCINRTAPEESVDGDYYIVGTPAMRGNSINYSEARRVDQEVFAAWNRRLQPREGDLLIAREAPVGPVVRIPAGGHVGAGQRTTLLRPNPDIIDARFLFYYLTLPATQSRFVALGHGSTTPHVRVEDVRNFSLPRLPDRSTQRAIAEVLGALDDRFAANQRAADLAEGLLRAKFDALGLIDEIDADGVLSDVLDLAPRRAISGEVPTLDMQALPTRGWSPAEPVIQQAKGGARFTNGDTLLARITPCLENRKTAYVDDLPEDTVGVGSTEFIVMRSREPYPLPLSFFVATDETFRSYAIQHMVGTSGRQRVSASDLAAFPIKLPGSAAVTEWGEVALPLFAKVRAMARENRSLAALRGALLPELMSGRLTVKDAESQVEEVV